jgi:hypothetical protein
VFALGKSIRCHRAKAMRLAHFLEMVTEGKKFFIPIGHNPLKKQDSEK